MQKRRENTEEKKLKEHSRYLTDRSYLESDLQTFLPRRMKTEHELNNFFFMKDYMYLIIYNDKKNAYFNSYFES